MNAVVREDIFLPCLRGLPLLDGLDDELARFIIAGSTLCGYSKGEIICKKGGDTEGLFCLLDGKVKLAVLSFQGSERVVEIIGPGGLLGESQVFHDRPSPVYAEALTQCELIFVRKRRILEAVRRYPDFALAMLGSMSARLHRLVQDVEICCLQSAAIRVANFLVHLAAAGDERQEAAHVELPAGKAVVASTLNLTPETFSRELHHLAGEGLISVERRTIRIHDLSGLKSTLMD